ncbi:MAG: right-handed parallel beta-helix repeat-containing protein [Planctomycetia bacterium]|nr:right-handed parallel beta-helix repeat-containing protein [Planctomycetia bacterium]
MSRMHYRLGISVVLLAFFSAAANAEILRVDQDSSGGDGSTWGLAFNNLQSCLAAAANGDEIWVADGTYLPGTSPTSSFTLISSIPELSLYGGFQGISRLGGGETAKAQRDFLTYKSVLTGDIPDTTDDCENVIRDETSDDLIILDGFTITGGVGTSGAGMVIISGSGPTIVNCRFIGNGPRNFSSDSFGGAIHFQGNSAAQVIDCVFENNRARQGGAIWLPSVSTFAPTIQRCRFEGNVAYWRGGAIENLNYTSSPGVQIRECRFIDNIAYAAPGEGIDSYKGGGAISNEGGLATLTNCVFIGNESAQNGGAINNFSNSNSFGTLTLRSCTLSENTAAWQAGGIWMQNGTMTLRNIVLWSNHDKDGTASSATQFNDNSNSPDVKYSCIQDDAPGGSIPYGSGSPNFNIDTDPVFINPSVGNLRLGSAGSGCVNSGNNSDVSGVSTDIDGRMRIMDTTVDRGAHESAFTLSGPTDCDSNSTADDVEIAADPSKDCNNNGILDICDVTPIGSGADCNSNGVPDDCDIASGTSFDCNTNGVPDDCEFEDCNHDCIDDSGQSLDDCDENESADVCEIAPP